MASLSISFQEQSFPHLQYSPAGPNYSPAGPNYSPAGSNYSPAGSSFSPAGPTYNPAGPTYNPAGPLCLDQGQYTGQPNFAGEANSQLQMQMCKII